MTHSFDFDGMPDENREHREHREHDDYNGHFRGGGLDELALRRLLHDAVDGIEPRPEGLHRLRQAVPARRARRRQAMVGTAAGVLLVGAALPTLVHAASGGGPDTTNTASATASQPVGSGAGGQGGHELGGDSGSTAGSLGEGHDGAVPGGGAPSASASGAVSGVSAAPSGTFAAAAPLCARQQLGNGSGHADPPDSEGRVYGSFVIVNTSNISCTVTGGDHIAVTGEGGTDASRIRVVNHIAGDAAAGLPAPAASPLVLGPGKGYKVAFAWVPASGGGTTGCASDSGGSTSSGGSTGGTSTSGGTTTGSTGSTSGSSTDSGTTTGGTAGTTSGGTSSAAANVPSDAGSASATPASGDGIDLSDIPQEGSPAVATTTISGACAGTVYHTEPLAATP